MRDKLAEETARILEGAIEGANEMLLRVTSRPTNSDADQCLYLVLDCAILFAYRAADLLGAAEANCNRPELRKRAVAAQKRFVADRRLIQAISAKLLSKKIAENNPAMKLGAKRMLKRINEFLKRPEPR